MEVGAASNRASGGRDGGEMEIDVGAVDFQSRAVGKVVRKDGQSMVEGSICRHWWTTRR